MVNDTFSPTEVDIGIYKALIELGGKIGPRIQDLGDSYVFDKAQKEEILGYIELLRGKDPKHFEPVKFEIIPGVMKDMNDVTFSYIRSVDRASAGVKKQHFGHEDFDDVFNLYRKLVGLADQKVEELTGHVESAKDFRYYDDMVRTKKTMHKHLEGMNYIYEMYVEFSAMR